MSLDESCSHILWTLQKSPKAYEVCRDMLTEVRIAIVNAELRYQEKQREKK